MNTKDKGDISVAVAISVFLEKGLAVLIPFGDNRRYDLVIEENGEFRRIQVKTGVVKKGTVRFRTVSSYHHRGRASMGYKGQIEAFAVYVPTIKKLYLVPVDGVGGAEGCLRTSPTKNGQVAKIRLASDFEL
jgi:hypothetical protein